MFSVSGGEKLEGWQTTEDGMDVFYMKRSGAASENAVEKNNTAMQQSTCIESTKLQAADQMIRMMIGETIEAQSGMLDGQTTEYAITSVRSGVISGDITQEECASTSDDTWKTCQCLYTVRGEGLREKVKLKVQEAASQ